MKKTLAVVVAAAVSAFSLTAIAASHTGAKMDKMEKTDKMDKKADKMDKKMDKKTDKMEKKDGMEKK